VKPKIIIVLLLALTGCMPIVTSTPTIYSNTREKTPQQITMTIPSNTPSFPSSTPLTPTTIFPFTPNIDTLISQIIANGQCNLPCVFTVLPGISTKENVNGVIEYFKIFQKPISNDRGITIEVYSKSEVTRGGGILSFSKEEYRVMISYYFVYDFTIDIGKVKNAVLTMGSYKDSGEGMDTITTISYRNPIFTELSTSYRMAAIFQEYGKPDNILIRPYPDDPDYPDIDYYPFNVILLYKKSGFLIEYQSLRKENGNYYIACPNESHVSISSWNPEIDMPLQNAVDHFSSTLGVNSNTIGKYRPIEEVTTMTIQEVMDLFVNGTFDTCISTNKSDWN